ncbi:MAG: DUF1080 domain-containing protein, partial [Anaerohalosphaera sp.]|nr:DUF1080 domain-containing protein [Anaerohalosphaera sp.]
NTLTRYVARPNAKNEKAMLEITLLAALDKAADSNVQAFYLEQIDYIATDTSVPQLSKLLADKSLTDPAARVLITIGTPKAKSAILNALMKASSGNIITLIKAAGVLQIEDAAPIILPHTKSEDTTKRLTALYAIADIAPDAPKYVSALEKATEAKSPFQSTQALEFYLLYAERLAQKDQASSALKICRSVLKNKIAPHENAAQCKALSIIAGIQQDKATPDLLAAMDLPNEYLHGTAVKIALNMSGSSVTSQWAKKIKTVKPAAQAKIMQMLADRGDKKALPAIVAMLKDSDQTARTSAIYATAQLGQADAVKPLLAFIATARSKDISTAKNALMTLPSDPLFANIGDSLDNVPAPAGVVLIDILAKRSATSQTQKVLALATSGNADIRRAATKALGTLANADNLPDLVASLLNAKSKSETSAAQKSIVAIIAKGDPAKVTSTILAAFNKADSKQKASLLPVMARLNTAEALNAIAKTTKINNAQLADAAIRALASSQDIAAAKPLLEVIAASEEPKYLTMAVRRYLQLVARADIDDDKKASMLISAMSVAKRSDEKKLIFSKLSQVRSVLALACSVQMLGDETLAVEAAAAVARIALPSGKDDKGLIGPGVGGLLLDAYSSITDADIRKQIDKHVRTMPTPTGQNLALNKPVTISCNQQGGNKPQFAVDGRADKNSAYWGTKWPSYLQVDLQQTGKIDSVHVWFYWDSRYYQYTVDVSTDGKTFKKVVDQSANTTPATQDGVAHKFAPIDARYVRLNITKNSDNEAVHVVEFEVYAKGLGHAQTVTELDVPEGFRPLFNGRDLIGWKGLLKGGYDNPIKRAKLSTEEYDKRQADADELMRKHWHVVDGVLYFDGGGFSLATDRDYGDFEMLVDWKVMHDRGDSGIYLRGTPQVQIWDPKQHKIGSGGLYNNQKNPRNPSKTADKPIGQWNTFRIKMIGEKVTVYLNGELIVDKVTLENYWDRKLPIFPYEQIELQCHGNPICFKNIFIREISRPDEFKNTGEFVSIFNGRDHTGWVGNIEGYPVEGGALVCRKGGNIYTEKEYENFVLKFDFLLTEGANNGLGIRAPLQGNAAYLGMELQVLDNTADKYKNLKEYQFHGSIYCVYASKKGCLKPVGQWNHQEVIAYRSKIKIILNGKQIVPDPDDKIYIDYVDISVIEPKDGIAHPGLKNKKGHIGFLGHGSRVDFKNIMIKELP